MLREKEAGVAVGDLLRQLVRYVEAERDVEVVETGVSDEVVLEMEVDGVYYALTRLGQESGNDSIHLSPREKEVARLVSKGLSNRTIAAVLEISPWTVSTHLRRVFAKLDVSSRAEMVARVLQDGLLE